MNQTILLLENCPCRCVCTVIAKICQLWFIYLIQAYNFYGRDDPSLNIPSCLHPTHIGGDVPSSLINPSPPARPQKKTLKKKSRGRKSKKDQQDSDGEQDVESSRYHASLYFIPQFNQLEQYNYYATQE